MNDYVREEETLNFMDKVIILRLQKLQSFLIYCNFVPIDSGVSNLISFTAYMFFIIFYGIVTASYFMDDKTGRKIRYQLADYFEFTGFPGVCEFIAVVLPLTGLVCRIILCHSKGNIMPLTQIEITKIQTNNKQLFLHLLNVYIIICNVSRILIFMISIVVFGSVIPANLEYKDIFYFIKSSVMVIYLHVLVHKLLLFMVGLCIYLVIVTQFIRYRINYIIELARRLSLENTSMSKQSVNLLDSLNEIYNSVVIHDRVIGKLIFSINCLICPAISIALITAMMRGSHILKAMIIFGCSFYATQMTTGSMSAALVYNKSQKCYQRLNSFYLVVVAKESKYRKCIIRCRLRTILKEIAAGKLSFSHGPMKTTASMTIVSVFGNAIQLTLMGINHFQQRGF
jgi:hypothetical protein